MNLFFMLLPLYLFGNIHCLGMCGPLVMLIGQHRFRHFYFAGRLISYSLAGLLAGEAGAVLHIYLNHYHLAAAASLLCGAFIIFWGLNTLFAWYETSRWMQWQWMGKVNHKLSTLLLQDTPTSTFLFGFFTVALPCGQTLVVFSACALAGDALVGLFNGFALALLTTPSLFLAMYAKNLFKKLKSYTNTVLGVSTVGVGVMACCRGMAEMGWIPHLIINPDSSPLYHIVIY
jgi:sulfite exporter TauE/SafE